MHSPQSNTESLLTLFTLFIILFFYLFGVGNINALRPGSEIDLLTTLDQFVYGVPIIITRSFIVLFSISFFYFVSMLFYRSYKVPLYKSLLLYASSFGILAYSRVLTFDIFSVVLFSILGLSFYRLFYKNDLSSFFWMGVSSFLLVLGDPLAMFFLIISSSILLCINQWLIDGEFYFSKLIAALITVGLSLLLILSTSSGPTLNFSLNLANLYFLPIYLFPTLIILPICFDRRFLFFTLMDPKARYFIILAFSNMFASILLNFSHYNSLLVSSFFILSFILLGLTKNNKSLGLNQFVKTKRLLLISHTIFICILILFSFYILSFPQISISISNTLIVLITTILLTISLFLIYKFQSFYFFNLTALFIIASIWVLLIPLFYLPIVPDRVANNLKSIDSKHIISTYSNRFFLQQHLQTTVHSSSHHTLDFSNLKDDMLNIFILYETDYLDHTLPFEGHIYDRWPIWKRGLRFNQIFKALRKHDLDALQTRLILYKVH